MDEVLPRWFFPVFNKIGLLPLVPREGVLKFNWPSALRALVTATVATVWCVYVSLAWISDAPKVDYVVKCWTAIAGSVYLGGALMIVTNVIKCKLKAFDKIVENLIIFNRFWKTKMAAEPSYVDLANVLLTYFLCCCRVLRSTFVFCNNESDSYFFIIPLTFFQIIHILMTAALVTVMSRVAQNFRRLNKMVKYCPYPHLAFGSGTDILTDDHSHTGNSSII